jgi:hypothetical protein
LTASLDLAERLTAARKGREALIADGYHRVCASYYTDEDTDIPVKIVKL